MGHSFINRMDFGEKNRTFSNAMKKKLNSFTNLVDKYLKILLKKCCVFSNPRIFKINYLHPYLTEKTNKVITVTTINLKMPASLESSKLEQFLLAGKNAWLALYFCNTVVAFLQLASYFGSFSLNSLFVTNLMKYSEETLAIVLTVLKAHLIYPTPLGHETLEKNCHSAVRIKSFLW